MKSNNSNTVRKDRTFVILMTVLFVFRLGMVAAYPLLSRFMPQWVWSNNDGYADIAINWVQTGTFALESGMPTATRLPAYPAVIAISYLLAGTSFPLVTMIIQAIFSTLTGYLLFKMANSLFGRATAIATTVLFILHPQVNNFIFRCATETFFTLILTGMLYSTVQYVQTQKRTALIGISIWLGLSLLTRPTLALPAAACSLLLLLWCAVDREKRKRRLAHVTLGIAIIAVILMPWIVRNHTRSGYAPVLQTWVGQPLFQGIYVSENLSEFLGRKKTISDLDAEALSIVRDKTEAFFHKQPPPDNRPVAREVLADHYVRKMVRNKILADPLYFISLACRNLIFAPVLQMTWKSTIVMMLWNWPVLVLAFIGALWSLCRQPNAFLQSLPVLVLFGYVLGIHAIIWPQARYILPAFVPFLMYAGVGIILLCSRFHAKR